MANRPLDRAHLHDLDDDDVRHYYHLTDALFSSVAMITATGANPLVVERVRYEAYGEGFHRWPGDFNDDGQVNSTDEDLLDGPLKAGGANIGDLEYDVLMDLNRDGQIDSTDMAIFQSMLAHWQSPLSPGRFVTTCVKMSEGEPIECCGDQRRRH